MRCASEARPAVGARFRRSLRHSLPRRRPRAARRPLRLPLPHRPGGRPPVLGPRLAERHVSAWHAGINLCDVAVPPRPAPGRLGLRSLRRRSTSSRCPCTTTTRTSLATRPRPVGHQPPRPEVRYYIFLESQRIEPARRPVEPGTLFKGGWIDVTLRGPGYTGQGSRRALQHGLGRRAALRRGRVPQRRPRGGQPEQPVPVLADRSTSDRSATRTDLSDVRQVRTGGFGRPLFFLKDAPRARHFGLGSSPPMKRRIRWTCPEAGDSIRSDRLFTLEGLFAPRMRNPMTLVASACRPDRFTCVPRRCSLHRSRTPGRPAGAPRGAVHAVGLAGLVRAESARRSTARAP